MHQRADGMADEVEQPGRRALAVELGEVAEHAAADRACPGSGAARGRELLPAGRLGPDAAGQRAFQIAGRRDRDPRRADADALDLALHVVQVARAAPRDRRSGLPAASTQGSTTSSTSSAPSDAGELAIVLGEAGIVALAGVELGDEVTPAPAARSGSDQIQRRRACSAGDRQADGGHAVRPSRAFDSDGDGVARRPPRPAGDAARRRQRDAAGVNFSPLVDRVGPGQSQRADIGLVGGVQPVALVLHLEGVALHAAGDAHAGQDLVGQGADVHERAGRDRSAPGTGCARRVPSTCSTSTGGAADAFQRMQDDEAGAVGDEVAERLALGRERRDCPKRRPSISRR